MLRTRSVAVGTVLAIACLGLARCGGGGLNPILATVRVDDNEDSASAGIVVITTSDAGRIAGTYDLTLFGGSASGTFDVEIRIENP